MSKLTKLLHYAGRPLTVREAYNLQDEAFTFTPQEDEIFFQEALKFGFTQEQWRKVMMSQSSFYGVITEDEEKRARKFMRHMRKNHKWFNLKADPYWNINCLYDEASQSVKRGKQPKVERHHNGKVWVYSLTEWRNV